MCSNEAAVQCKLLVQTIQDFVERAQDVLFLAQEIEAPASGYVSIAIQSIQNGIQGFAAAADHLQYAANSANADKAL